MVATTILKSAAKKAAKAARGATSRVRGANKEFVAKAKKGYSKLDKDDVALAGGTYLVADMVEETMLDEPQRKSRGGPVKRKKKKKATKRKK